MSLNSHALFTNKYEGYNFIKSDSSTVILIILFIGNVKKLSKDYLHTKGLSFAAHLLPVHSYKSLVEK